MTPPRGDGVSDIRAEAPAVGEPSVVPRLQLVPLVLSAALSAALLLQPGLLLIRFWFVQVEMWFRPELPYPPVEGQVRLFALTAVTVAAVALHWLAAVRWPRPWARRLSALGLVAAVMAAWLAN